MNDDTNQATEQVLGRQVRDRQLGRLGRLVLKELREILRDRRTIITLVVMPLLIYPLLAVAFQRFLFTSLASNQSPVYVIGVDSEIDQQMLARQLHAGEANMTEQERSLDSVKLGPESNAAAEAAKKLIGGDGETIEPEVTIVAYPDDDLKRFVADSSLHVAVVHRRDRRKDEEKGLQTPLVWELIYRVGSAPSEAALHFVESRLQAFNKLGLDAELKRMGAVVALPAATERHPVGYSGAPNFSLAALIPLILVLMTVTGAVYPAIDLTAGERERGTLETLIAAPVPRLGLLLAKYAAVLTVALLTAVVNLIGMTITAHSSGLAAGLFGTGMSFGVVIKVLLLLALFAAFFSAILLALTSYARSFKEAQAYIIPLMLLCLVPGILCLIPGLEFAGWMAVTPLVNIVMLARDLLEGTVQPGLAIAAICSTVFYIAAAIAIAARIFGTDAILYGSQATWSDLVRRPSEVQREATLPAAMLGLALIFPAFFILANSLGRSVELSIERQLVVRALITATIFGGIPVSIAMMGRVQWASGLGIRGVRATSLAAAFVLGLSLWPMAHEVTWMCSRFGLLTINPDLLKHFESLVNQFQTQPLWLLLVTLALAPAVFEELCFRGFLFGALRTRLSGVWTVVIAAALFGFFHEVLFPGKLIPTAALGLVLGWLRLQTGSILPGIVLHAVHNGVVLAIVHHRDALAERGWGVQETAHFPPAWHALAAVGIVIGVAVLLRSKQFSEELA